MYSSFVPAPGSVLEGQAAGVCKLQRYQPSTPPGELSLLSHLNQNCAERDMLRDVVPGQQTQHKVIIGSRRICKIWRKGCGTGGKMHSKTMGDTTVEASFRKVSETRVQSSNSHGVSRAEVSDKFLVLASVQGMRLPTGPRV